MKKILQLLSNHPSYDNIRIIQPLKMIQDQLKAHNVVVSMLPIQQITKEIVQQFDVCCFHGCVSLAVFSFLRNTKFCLFVDDLMTDLNPSNPARTSPQEQEGLKWCYKNAKSLVCTTKFLSNHLYDTYGVSSFTCPNLIDIEFKQNNSTNILYSFGNSHTGDLELLNGLNTDRNVYFFGHTLPSKFCDYQRNKKGEVELFPNQDNIFWTPMTPNYEQYHVWMKNLDYGVGLIPLEDNVFNEAKSILKFGEYLSHGAISVASPVGALNEIPSECCVKISENNWADSKDALAYAFDHHSSIYESAFTYWNDIYSYDKQSQKWLEAYREM